MANAGTAAPPDKRKIRQPWPQRALCPGKLRGVTFVQSVAASSSAWLRMDALARIPRMSSASISRGLRTPGVCTDGSHVAGHQPSRVRSVIAERL
jgi:hypothetical protein